MCLQGDSNEDIPEIEKHPVIKTVNFYDRNVSNLLTKATADPEREKARKALAVSFSTSSLHQTWPFIEEALNEEFATLRGIAASGGVYDCRKNVLQLMLRILGRSAFGIEFTFDGSENENNISGLEYLAAQNKAASERMKELSMPFRQHMFWLKDVQLGREADKSLNRIARKMVEHHSKASQQTSHSKAEVEGSGARSSTARQSLMQHLASHAYSSPAERMSDVNILTFAGHDTTGFSLCFFLMEMARHPHIRHKLQVEIDAVMPPRTSAHPTVGRSSSSTVDAAVDQKLLSTICGLEYLNMCMKEAMRLWPVAAIGSVRQLPEDMHWAGMTIPKGSSIRPHVFSMFRERWIDRPTEFLPERWSSANPQLPRLKEMFIPFSVGKRACIGQNMAMFQLRIVSVFLLHHFDFELVGEPTFEFFVTLKPDELLMTVKERNTI